MVVSMNLLSKFKKPLLIILPAAFFGYIFTPAGELTKADVLAGGILGLFKLNVTFPAWVVWIIGFALIYAGWTIAGNSKNETLKPAMPRPHPENKELELTDNQKRLFNYFKNTDNELEHAGVIAKNLQTKEIEVQHELNELLKHDYVYCNYNYLYGDSYKLTEKGVAYAVRNMTGS